MSDKQESGGQGEHVAFRQDPGAGMTTAPLETWGPPRFLCLGDFPPSLTALGIYLYHDLEKEWGNLGMPWAGLAGGRGLTRRSLGKIGAPPPCSPIDTQCPAPPLRTPPRAGRWAGPQALFSHLPQRGAGGW